MAGSKLPGELTWPKLLGTSLAAVVAAWLAGHLNLGNTMTGVAIGSIIATFGSAFFSASIDKSHQAIVVRTDRGTVIEARADSDVDGPSGTAVLPSLPLEPEPPHAPDTQSRWRQVHWRAVVVAAIVTMAVTLAAISIYESVVGRTWGSNEPGTTIGNTVHGGPRSPSPTPSVEPSESPTPTETPSASPTPTAEPSATPTPTDSPSPGDCATTTPPAGQSTAPPQECPQPGDSTQPGGSLPLIP